MAASKHGDESSFWVRKTVRVGCLCHRPEKHQKHNTTTTRTLLLFTEHAGGYRWYRVQLLYRSTDTEFCQDDKELFNAAGDRGSAYQLPPPEKLPPVHILKPSAAVPPYASQPASAVRVTA